MFMRTRQNRATPGYGTLWVRNLTMKLYDFQHQDQKFTYTDHEIRLPASATDTLRRILGEWQRIFPHEDTLIQSRHNVPSLFVRFDFVISPDGQLRIYELQEGPAWVGYTGVANETFRRIRDETVREEWPGLKVLRSGRQADKDDEIWLQRATIEEALEGPGPLIVRNLLPASLSYEQRAAIVRKSLRPVFTHNNKLYGVHLGWWKPVSWQDSSHGTALPWDEEFVLKPQSGYGSADIMLWKPHDRAGRSTRTQIERVLEKRGTMYLQPLIRPMLMDINGTPYNFIYRPYFMYSAEQKKYVPAHGVWTARPHPAIRIHGASDSISGPLYME